MDINLLSDFPDNAGPSLVSREEGHAALLLVHKRFPFLGDSMYVRYLRSSLGGSLAPSVHFQRRVRDASTNGGAARSRARFGVMA